MLDDIDNNNIEEVESKVEEETIPTSESEVVEEIANEEPIPDIGNPMGTILNGLFNSANNKSDNTASFGDLSYQDYKPLFDIYSKLFEQMDNNSNFLKMCIDKLNLQVAKAKRMAFFGIVFGLAALVLGIIAVC